MFAERPTRAARWLSRSIEGVCGVTPDVESSKAACQRTSKGFFKLNASVTSQGWLVAAAVCLDHCQQCERCHIVSLSLRYGDCSWFDRDACTPPLQLLPTGFRSAPAARTDRTLLPPSNTSAPRHWAGVGGRLAKLNRNEGDFLDKSQDKLIGAANKGTVAVTGVMELPLVPSPAPQLLVGLISGNPSRRAVLRSTWVGEVQRSGTARVRFVVGKEAPDGERPDVFVVGVAENQPLQGGPSGGTDGTLLTGALTWTQYAKVVAFIRYAATQPEPLIAKGDDDVFVVPQMLDTYVRLLLETSRNEGDADLVAGVFEWYSWKPATMAAKAWGQARQRSALLSDRSGSLVEARCSHYTCNCSAGGGGWLWDGWELHEAPAQDNHPARAASSACVGPQAFPKGPLKMLTAGTVRWLVGSARFVADTRYAEQLLGGTPVAEAGEWAAQLRLRRTERARRVELSEDAQMGYWLAAHPSLRYVHFSQFRAWLASRSHFSRRGLRCLLSVHQMPEDEMASVLREMQGLWAASHVLHVHTSCSARPPCDPLLTMCAHLPGQRVCRVYARLNGSVSSPSSRMLHSLTC